MRQRRVDQSIASCLTFEHERFISDDEPSLDVSVVISKQLGEPKNDFATHRIVSIHLRIGNRYVSARYKLRKSSVCICERLAKRLIGTPLLSVFFYSEKKDSRYHENADTPNHPSTSNRSASCSMIVPPSCSTSMIVTERR